MRAAMVLIALVPTLAAGDVGPMPVELLARLSDLIVVAEGKRAPAAAKELGQLTVRRVIKGDTIAQVTVLATDSECDLSRVRPHLAMYFLSKVPGGYAILSAGRAVFDVFDDGHVGLEWSDFTRSPALANACPGQSCSLRPLLAALAPYFSASGSYAFVVHIDRDSWTEILSPSSIRCGQPTTRPGVYAGCTIAGDAKGNMESTGDLACVGTGAIAFTCSTLGRTGDANSSSRRR